MICDRTGWKVRAPRMKLEWDNLMIRKESWEPRQPQDFVRGVRDDQTVPIARPRQVDQFQGPLGTQLSASFSNVAPGPPGPWFLQVQSAVRMYIGDTLNVMSDLGEMMVAKIVDVPNALTIQIDRNLPWTASAGNVVINVTAESDAVISYPAGTV